MLTLAATEQVVPEAPYTAQQVEAEVHISVSANKWSGFPSALGGLFPYR